MTLHPEMLGQPLRWAKPRVIFVNSMGDLFHEDIPFPFIARAFEVMGEAYWHTFQVLTKRAARLGSLSTKLRWPPNIWVGVTVENSECIERIKDLVRVPATVRFLSLEPLLGPLPRLPLNGVHWVIVGGESGPRARPMRPDWIRSIRDQCKEKNVPFFFKQWGGVWRSRRGRILDGMIWDQEPEAAYPTLQRSVHPAPCRRVIR